MSTIAQQAASMIDMLPEKDQMLAFELLKKLVIAWDPDFTKTTPEERKAIDQAEQDFTKGTTVSHDQIDWN